MLLAICAGALAGCPQKTKSEDAPSGVQTPAAVTKSAPPLVVAPQPGAEPDKVVPPAPRPKNQGEAWDKAATKQTNWRVGLAKACKQEAERTALLSPFETPSTELLRVVAFARAFPCYDAGLGHAARLDHQLKRLYKDEGFLSATPIKVESTAAGALLLLADAKLLSRARFVLTDKGWQSPRQGLGDGTYAAGRAKALLKGVELARDGRWAEATPVLSAALRAEGAAVSDRSGDPLIQRTWASLAELLDRPDSKQEQFTTALDRWSASFLRKDLKGPVLKNKKG